MRTFLIALASLSALSASAVSAENAVQPLGGVQLAKERQALQRQIHKCLRVRASANAKATISFVLGETGSVEGQPVLVEEGTDEHGKRLAVAAIRAVTQCAPYDTRLTGKVVAPFSLVAEAPRASTNGEAELDLGPAGARPSQADTDGQKPGAARAPEKVPGQDAEAIRAHMLTCFSPPSGATGRVVVALDVDEHGVARDARVVSPVTTDGERALASAGIRAVFRCSPYETQTARKLRVVFDVPEHVPADNSPASKAKAETDYIDDRIRTAELGGVSFRFEVPAGFCAIDPAAGPFDRGLWERLTPPKERNVELIALDIDCETHAEGRSLAKVIRPKRAFMLGGASRDPDLPAKLDDFLAVMHERNVRREPLTPRFWQDPPVEGTPVVGLDEYGLYLASRSLNKDGSIAVAGMVSFTLAKDRQIYFTRMEFGGTNLTDDMPGSMMRAVRSMHDLSE
jgi:hypothetical protein